MGARGENGRLVQLTQIDRGRARAHYRRRFSAVLVGVVGLVWWIPPWLLSSHALPWVLALWLLGGAISAACGVVAIVIGVRHARALALDYHEQQASEDRFTLVGVYHTRGPTLYRWQSGQRRIECRRDDVPWQPSLGEAARIRYLPRSGAVLEVSTVGDSTAG
jgi:hypothetical protein